MTAHSWRRSWKGSVSHDQADGDVPARGQIASSPTRAIATRAAANCCAAGRSRTQFPSAAISVLDVRPVLVARWSSTRPPTPRNVVERCINRLKQWRGLATRYEKRAVNYRAMVVLASIVLWLES